jgi:hypothetical protein
MFRILGRVGEVLILIIYLIVTILGISVICLKVILIINNNFCSLLPMHWFISILHARIGQPNTRQWCENFIVYIFWNFLFIG